jgi:hypothetical protein
MKPSFHIASGVVRFYFEGFRNMSAWGRKVWIIIIIKLIIIFAVLKLFFFPDFMKKNYSNDIQRSEYILEELTNSNAIDD